MYISQMPHFLDETGNIPKEMPKEARPQTLTTTEIRCFKKGCQGIIKSEILGKKDDIYWICSKCPNEGVISEWQKTKWDNRLFRK